MLIRYEDSGGKTSVFLILCSNEQSNTLVEPSNTM